MTMHWWFMRLKSISMPLCHRRKTCLPCVFKNIHSPFAELSPVKVAILGLPLVQQLVLLCNRHNRIWPKTIDLNLPDSTVIESILYLLPVVVIEPPTFEYQIQTGDSSNIFLSAWFLLQIDDECDEITTSLHSTRFAPRTLRFGVMKRLAIFLKWNFNSALPS